MNITYYQTYFKEQIFDKYIKLKEIYYIDFFEFDNFIKDLRNSNLKTPILLIESYETETIGNGLYNIHDKFKCGLSVLGSFDLKNIKNSEKTTFLAELENIAQQIRAKMLIDKRSSPCNIMQGLDENSIGINRTEYIAGSYTGYRIDFILTGEAELNLDNDWI